MTRTGFWIRLAISVAIDVLDFTIGRLLIPIPFLGEGVGALMLSVLWGPAGLLYLAEVIDVTEQLDGFVPMATLIGLFIGWRRGFLFGREPRTPDRPRAAGKA